MQFPLRVFIFLTRLVGLLFIGGSLIFGYAAVELIFDPEATVIVNGMERNDREAKGTYLLAPIILLIVGVVLCKVKPKSWHQYHQARSKLWSFFYGK
ncbi:MULTISPECIES: hypothetical protein [Alteromonas]|jgi:hypothetical protein|uniref:Uncharacterized protein n=1 Tax=Alteromonas stellipolaris TaxID=233316 RepID=A0AAW7YY43_9ALTE|nr:MULTISPECIES: hypothetical protein [Alteromonas]AMJ90974.1 hypothetical protein AV940_11125 [Alteromonas sp. Mac2]ALM90274.1 hypothetical protein AOR13_1231 [Alteromonas stellipolaris LMG 21856]AMJ74712.1 hypothetical protein AVL57_12520 [Alteromonas stellipolaris]AMJ87112.1 hypothetical protein AV939_11360 [Alteromonas sp. Mac1]ANB22161.1 hypothetical protein A6K25_13295 [Alteromonas stellipolaris]